MKYITIDHTLTETVTVDGAPVERERAVQLVVAGPSTIRMGMTHSLLIEEQNAIWEAERLKLANDGWTTLELFSQGLLRTNLYPNLIASVSEATGFDHWPITFEEFMSLPEELGIKWEEAAAELNPHWVPKPDPQTMAELEELRKKVMSGTFELSTG
jgi:hypothetical protein